MIYNRRGLGYFVAPGAREGILEARRSEFMGRTLPSVFRDMRLLGIGIDEVTKRLAGGRRLVTEISASIEKKRPRVQHSGLLQRLYSVNKPETGGPLPFARGRKPGCGT